MSATVTCLNCGAELRGLYCSICGQRQVNRDLTLRELIEDTTQERAHWEGKVPQTLKTLFLEQPGRLTLEFFAGKRARWLTPLRIYSYAASRTSSLELWRNVCHIVSDASLTR